MRTKGMSMLAAGLALALLCGCETLPDSAKLANPLGGGGGETGKPVGNNQVGEACEYRPNSLRDVDLDAARAYGVWCGTWRQPSGRIYEATQQRSGAAQLTDVANTSLWRSYLNQRLTCAAPAATTILDGVPAVLLQCSEHNGGWPHVALATTLGGKTFLMDGVPSATPAIEATVAILTDHAAPAATRSAAAELVGQRLASQPFGSGDLDRYYGLMQLGDQKNAIDDFAGAEDAFRDALAVQQKILGASNPGLAMPLMHLALQLSNQQRFAEADALFARASGLQTTAPDPLISARLDYYLAMNALNRKQADKAKELANKAEQDYVAFVPPDMRQAALRGDDAARSGSSRNPALGALQPLIVDPQAEQGIRGLAAVWRLQSSMAYEGGAYDESRAIARKAQALLRVSNLNPPGTVPRVIRIAALSAARAGDAQSAARGLSESTTLFDQLTPNEKPLAITLFLAGGEAHARGDAAEALRQFRAGAKILEDRHLGLPESLVMPFLQALSDEAGRNPAHAPALYAEMFEASQLVQGSLTAQYIAKAAARLAAGDQKVSQALRQLQEAELALKTLFGERDVEAEKPANLQDIAKLAKLDQAIAEAEANRNEAEAAAQAAAPAYGQLIQASVSSKVVQDLLLRDEGFWSFQLGSKASFGFFLTNRQVTAYRIKPTLSDAAKAVDHLRQTAQVETDVPVFDVAAAHGFYQELFGPMAGKTEGIKRIVISNNGPLLSLPFEMLVTEPTSAVANGDYRNVPFLLKRYAVSYVPAPQTFARLRQVKAASSAPAPYLGFGDVRRASRAQLAASFPRDRCQADLEALERLPDLPGTRREILNVSKLLGGGPGDVLLGDKFSKAALASIDFARYRVVHFATHAFLPTELRCLPEPAILMSVPAQDDSAKAAFLGSDEVLRLQMDADLVVLSACNTAGPGGAAGESLSGLARAFFFAGTRGLLVTHWSVDDESAEFITTHTMLGMKPGASQEDTTLAVRQAKLDRLMNAGTPGGPDVMYSHPFAWAPFVLIGDGLRVRTETANEPPSAAGASGG